MVVRKLWSSRLFSMQRGGGGQCWKEGVVYALVCQECGEDVATYLESQDEMRTREDENTLKNCWQKTKTTLSFGCTLSITTKAVRMSTIQWRW